MLDPELVWSGYAGIPPGFRRAMLTEYLQYKTLGFIYGTGASSGLVFMGGTALRIFYGTRRFSEDLDFDTGRLSSGHVPEIARRIERGFLLEGVECHVTLRNTEKLSAVVRFQRILQAWGLTGHKDQVLKLKIDGEPQHYHYSPAIKVLNRLDVTATVSVAPDSLILAQKLHATLQRRRILGRDLYDAVFLFGRTSPDMAYLLSKQGTDDRGKIADSIISRLSRYSMRELAADVLPFLMDGRDIAKVELFPRVLRDWADILEESGDGER